MLPRNNDEPVEWPDEDQPTLQEAIQRIELIEDLFDPLEPQSPQEEQQ